MSIIYYKDCIKYSWLKGENMRRGIVRFFISVLIVMMITGETQIVRDGLKENGPEKAYAAELLTLQDLQAKFPAGKYWNHLAKSGHGYNNYYMCTNCGNPDGWTDYPCTIQGFYSSPGQYACNGWYGLQCNGFVRKLANDAYGSNYSNFKSWTIGSIDNVKPGDVIHYYGGSGEMAADPQNGHYVMVIAVNGNVLTFGECNSDGHCKITWHRTMNVKATASSYTVYSAPWELAGGTNSSTVDVGNGFYGYIINTDQWRHMTNDENNVSLRAGTGAPNQVWYFERLSNGDYAIKSVADNKYLEVANNSSSGGANVQTGVYGNQSGQTWCIYGESGRYVFGVRCSNCVLELKDHSTAEGANICVNTPWDTVRQYWQIWKLDDYVQATGVTLNKTSITLNVKGATASLSATVSPSNTTDKSVSYSSSNTAVAKVDANGKVTAVGNGTATITATTKSGSRTATCKVTVSLKPEDDGWFYVTDLPTNVTSTNYDIQYQNIYEKYAATSPGTGWIDTGVDKKVETKDGAMYELGYPIATSETVRLEGYYYYHWCGPNAGTNNVNYESRDVFVHLDRVSADRAWEYASYTDPDDSRYTYYYLKWSDNSDAYCLGNSTCSEGHAERSYYWYKSYMYQNYKIENLNLYQKTSNWGNSKDSSATKVNIRYRLKPTSVSLNKTTATLTSKGATVTLTATIAPTDAGCKNVTWKSSNTSVATVNNNGIVTAVGNGTATITATTESGGKTAICKVTVSIAPTGVTLNQTSATMTSKGQTITLTATVSPSNAANKNVTWKSSNTAVATVDSNGKVTAVGNGTATITATTESGGKTATCKVTVSIAPTKVTLNKTSVTLTSKGETVALTATVAPSDAANKGVTWKSDNTEVATVDSNGKVTAVGNGTATITVTTVSGGKTATCQVKVSIAPVKVLLDRTNATLTGKGKTVTLIATVIPADADNQIVLWKSSDTSVAAVDSNGKVTAVGVGSAIITAIADGAFDVKATCEIIVKEVLGIITQPISKTVTEGEKTEFSVVAKGEGLTYQWQYSKSNGVAWANSSSEGAKTATLVIYGKLSTDGRLYRCIITDSEGNKLITSAVKLTVTEAKEELAIVTNPVSQSIKVGEKAKFTVVAQGEGLTYQWQYSKSNGASWANSSSEGAKTATLVIEGKLTRDGQLYRCIITDSEGNKLITSAVKLTVTEAKEELAIVTNPVSQRVEVGEKAKFTVVAKGEGLTYQWQYSKSNGAAWANSSSEGSKTATLVIEGKFSSDGRLYRCIITDSEGNKVISSAAKLTVTEAKEELAIITNPTDQSVEVGEKAEFTVEAKGEGLSYQWQYSKSNGAAWANSSSEGSKTATLVIEGKLTRDGQLYRCVIMDSEGNQLTSSPAKLQVRE